MSYSLSRRPERGIASVQEELERRYQPRAPSDEDEDDTSSEEEEEEEEEMEMTKKHADNAMMNLRPRPARSFTPRYSPFHKHRHTVLEPLQLPSSYNRGYKMKAQMKLPVTVTDKHLWHLSTSEKEFPRREVHMRFFNTSRDKNRLSDEFPSHCTIKINDVALPKLDGISRPVNITSHVMGRAKEKSLRIILNWTADIRKWAVAIYVVKRINSEMVRDALLNSTSSELPSNITESTIRQRYSRGEDEDVAMDSLKVSLLCPLGKTRMKIAARSRNCTHIQCFDLESYLQMNENSPRWKCCVCNKDAPFRKIVIDKYFTNMLKELGRSVTDVELLKDATYKAIENVSPDSDDEALIRLSDDELIKDSDFIVIRGDNDSGGDAHTKKKNEASTTHVETSTGENEDEGNGGSRSLSRRGDSARRTENTPLSASTAQRMAISSSAPVETNNRDDQDESEPPLGAMDMEVEGEGEKTDTSDGERRGSEQRGRKREKMASRLGTASRTPRRDREVEETEMDETSQQIRPEKRGRRRRKGGERDAFGNDLTIDMVDWENPNWSGRRRARREQTGEGSQRPEKSNGRRKRAATRSAEREEEENEDEEMEMGGLEDTVVREKRREKRRQSGARDAWKHSYPPWMQAVKRKRFPYVAQLGDHVVYFRQGHESYLSAVQTAKLYPIEPKMIPKPDIGMEEFAVVDDIRYTLRPYRLTQLKLARTDSEGRRTGTTWTVKHHELENVPPFIILRAFYEEGLAMGLDVGDDMAAPIDDVWRMGTVENMSRNESYPNAHWQSMGVRWDNGENDALSPWDVRKETTGRRSGQPVSEEEVTQMGTAPAVEGDWPEGDESGEATMRRMLRAIETIRESHGAKDFRSPVDVEAYSDYPSKVPYPMDLTTICQRIENQYYRRLRSLLQDVRHVALSAETYNVKGSRIVRHARVLVEAIVRLANDPSIDDVVGFFDSCFDLPDNELLEYKRKPREVNSEMVEIPGEEETARARGGEDSAPGWIREAAEILEDLMQQPCARHFVTKDNDEAPVCLDPLWDDPACYDLRTLCEKVRACEMGNPMEVEGKVHLLVSTANNCIQNRTSEIYKDLEALQSQFNARFKSLIFKFEQYLHFVQGGTIPKDMGRCTISGAVPESASKKKWGGVVSKTNEEAESEGFVPRRSSRILPSAQPVPKKIKCEKMTTPFTRGAC